MACSSRFARCRIATSSSVKGGGHHSPSWSSSKLWLLCLLSFCPCMAKMLTITCAWWEKSHMWMPTTKYLAIYSGCSDNGGNVVGYTWCIVGLRPSWKAKWTFKPTIQIFGTMFARHILARMTKDTPRHTCAKLWAKQSVLSANWWRQRLKFDKQTKWLSSSISQSPTLSHRSSDVFSRLNHSKSFEFGRGLSMRKSSVLVAGTLVQISAGQWSKT